MKFLPLANIMLYTIKKVDGVTAKYYDSTEKYDLTYLARFTPAKQCD